MSASLFSLLTKDTKKPGYHHQIDQLEGKIYHLNIYLIVSTWPGLIFFSTGIEEIAIKEAQQKLKQKIQY